MIVEILTGILMVIGIITIVLFAIWGITRVIAVGKIQEVLYSDIPVEKKVKEIYFIVKDL